MKSYITVLQNRRSLDTNAYFNALHDNTFEKDDFLETQIQLFFVVRELAQYLPDLARKVPEAESYLSIFSAFIESCEDEAFSKEYVIYQTIEQLGFTQKGMDKKALWPESKAVITAIAGLCHTGEFYAAAAALFMIDQYFHEAKTNTLELLLQNKWVSAAETESPRPKARHLEPFQVLEALYGQDESIDYQIEQGLELGAYLWTSLYEGLYASRKRRYGRTINFNSSSLLN